MVCKNEKVQGGTMTWEIIDSRDITYTDRKAKTTEELAHDTLYDDLNDAIGHAAEKLDPPHVIHVGLDYFVGLAYRLAKDPETADVLIDETIKRAKNEYK